MKEFWIDFQGYIKVTAIDKDDAEFTFFQKVNKSSELKDICIEIDSVEEIINDIQ